MWRTVLEGFLGYKRINVVNPAFVVKQWTITILFRFQSHYYQPMWTLVGGGIKKFAQTQKPTGSILPQACSWLKETVIGFDPDNSKIFTSDGKQVGTCGCQEMSKTYELLKLKDHKIK